MALVRQGLPVNMPVHVQFDGGYVTDAEEIRLLGDEEVASLAIKTDDIEIHLNHRQAIAIGDEQRAEDIYRLWARTRLNSSGDLRLATILEASDILTVTALAIFGIVDVFIIRSNIWPFVTACAVGISAAALITIVREAAKK